MMRTSSGKLNAACLILAGGQGKRLTPDKPLLEIGGRPIIQRTACVAVSLFEEVLIVTNSPEKYRFLALPLVADERQGCGPLMGIYSGLRRIMHQAAFVCAADMPFLNEEVIRRQFQELDAYDIVVPCPQGRPEFLHAFYRKECLPLIREALDANIFRIETPAQRCKALRLKRDWFQQQGLMEQMELAFVNINTLEDYQRWLGPGQGASGRQRRDRQPSPEGMAGPNALQTLAPAVLQEIRNTLIEQETSFQSKSADEELSSLWMHSSRVGRIANHLAEAEGVEPEPALLAGLLHDTGKFAHGSYHEEGVAEEENAAKFAKQILAGTVYEQWTGIVSQAILTMHLEGEACSELGRALYDADCLDKLGCMGVAQFFTKNTLRRRFLSDELLARASIELTYAHHAQYTLKTATGRALARERNIRTRRFYTELLEEWAQLGLGALEILEEDISGIICILVAPSACPCGGSLDIESDILDGFKCRSAVMKYSCQACGRQSEYSFCLPNLKGLPKRRRIE